MSTFTKPPGTGVTGLYNVNSDGTYTQVVQTDGTVVAPVVPGDIPLPDSQVLVGNVLNVAAPVALSGDISIDNTGVTQIGAGKVTELKLDTDAVTTAKIADANVTDAKINTVNLNKGFLQVLNKVGAPVAPGTFVNVYVSAAGASPTLQLADCSTGVPAMYVVTNNGLPIGIDQYGYVSLSAMYGSLDTSAAMGVGSPLYLSTAGGYTFDTPPVNAAQFDQIVGWVVSKDAMTGVILFEPQAVMGVGSDMLKTSAVTAPKLGASFPFAGTPDVISPTAALDGAPMFTGNALAGHSHTTTATGSVAAPVFTGDALSTHSHNVQNIVEESVAVVANVGTLAVVPALIQSVYLAVSGLGKVTVQMIPSTEAPASGQVSVNMATKELTFFAGDAVVTATVTYIKAPVSAVSAGTPSGTNSAPAFTGDAVASDSVSAGTPAGTNSTPTITVTGANYTPAGTITPV